MMLRILFALVGALAWFVVSAPAFAKDDGGFGAGQIPMAAPAALGDYVAGDIGENPADIEPAAGDDAAVIPAEEKLGDDAVLGSVSAANPASAPVVETPDTKDAPKE